MIVFLSEISVSKRGYIQKEFKIALSALDEMPNDSVFLIPVRLDDCKVPYQFESLHWIDLSEKNTFSKIIQTIKITYDKRRSNNIEPNKLNISTENDNIGKLLNKILLPSFVFFILLVGDFLAFIFGNLFINNNLLLSIRFGAYFLFSVLLLYIVFLTFQISFSKYLFNLYNFIFKIVIFIFIQILAYLISLNVNIQLDKINNYISALCVSLITSTIIILLAYILKLPNENKKIKYDYKNISIYITILFSIAISLFLIYHKYDSFSFISWGVAFGIIFSSLVIKADKLIFILLILLKNTNPEYFFNIYQLNDKIEANKQELEIMKHENELMKRKMEIKSAILSNEFEKELLKIQYESKLNEFKALKG